MSTAQAKPHAHSDAAWAEAGSWHPDGSVAKSKVHPLALLGGEGAPARSRRGWFKVYGQGGSAATRSGAFGEVLLSITAAGPEVDASFSPNMHTSSPTVWF